ncbi:unnamed protein product [Bursaphelenchus xylophilus]|uniref:(pine wood nematode) hypothetical protein n=1 Tax=Bursaphelenchus xylophilus TaxID=6326 RepID=A0A811K7E4_BURXY|nr:unnamed protein product [Bursaphelenchus xylophilus]CAG9088055.1 unnamed protein product [Bursaphelenchus xylophilus]
MTPESNGSFENCTNSTTSLPAQDGTYMAEIQTNDLNNMEFYRLFISINPSLESVNLWNTFPVPTFNVPIPAQDGTYMAETLTNDLDNMEYIGPRFHCRIPNVYHPFFAINLNITFTHATFPVPFATPILPSHSHSHRTPPPFHSHDTPPPIALSSEFYRPFVSINPALKSVNLWNAFPNPSFNVPIPAKDCTYMAETQTNDRNNMENIGPRFHCPTPNVYHPFFTINLNITFIYATFLGKRIV